MFYLTYFFGVPHLATCIFLIFYIEPELGVEIDPGMALTPLPSSIGWGLNLRSSDHEPSALPLDHSFCFALKMLVKLTPGLPELSESMLSEWNYFEHLESEMTGARLRRLI